jgi:hypothetical protein
MSRGPIGPGVRNAGVRRAAEKPWVRPWADRASAGS